MTRGSQNEFKAPKLTMLKDPDPPPYLRIILVVSLVVGASFGLGYLFKRDSDDERQKRLNNCVALARTECKEVEVLEKVDGHTFLLNVCGKKMIAEYGSWSGGQDYCRLRALSKQ